MSFLGIDIASGQNVNWNQIKNDGYRFAIIKASEGHPDDSTDDDAIMAEYFDRNVKQANDAGVLCGAYHFLRATNANTGSQANNYSAETEAKFFVKNVKRVGGFNAVKLPLCMDIEADFYKDSSKKALNTAIAKSFALEVSKAGFLPCLYLNTAFMTYYYNMSEFGDLPLWYAHHNVTESEARSECTSAWCWQAGIFKINGITQTGPEKGTDKDYSFVDFLTQNNSAQAVFPRLQTKTGTQVYIDYCEKKAYVPRGYSENQIMQCMRSFSSIYTITVHKTSTNPTFIAMDNGFMECQSCDIVFY